MAVVEFENVNNAEHEAIEDDEHKNRPERPQDILKVKSVHGP